MPIGDPYASVAELELRLGTSDDGSFTSVLDGVSRDLERYCGRQFNKTTTAAARTYYPTDRHRVQVDDFHTVTDLAVATDPGDDGTFEQTWTAADYQLWPLGGLIDGVPGWPFYWIVAIESLTFPCGTKRPSVQVTAQWGWTAVPAAVKTATLAAAEAVIGRDKGQVAGESFDGYAIQYARTGSDSPFYGLARYRLGGGLLVA